MEVQFGATELKGACTPTGPHGRRLRGPGATMHRACTRRRNVRRDAVIRAALRRA